MDMKSLEELIHAARVLGKTGIALVAHGPSGPYVAMCMGCDGKPCDPRNWGPQPTPDAALEDLARQLTPDGVQK
jgi:hypothetical protein